MTLQYTMNAVKEDNIAALIVNGNVKQLDNELKNGLDVNHYFRSCSTFGLRGKTLLHLAVINDIEIAKLLISYKCNVNRTVKVISDDTGTGTIFKPFRNQNCLQYTCLYSAMCSLNTPMVEVLVQGGANVNFYDSMHCTALWHAVDINDPAMVRAVLQAKECDVNGVDSTRSSPLHVAAMRNNIEILILLIFHGAVIDIPQIEHATPLCAACKLGNLEAVMCLLQHGANPNGRNIFESGSTTFRPLVVALTYPKSPRFTYKLLDMLIEAGADLPPFPWFLTAIPMVFALNYSKVYDWLKEQSKQPKTLKTCCSKVLLSVLRSHTKGRTMKSNVDHLELPRCLKSYLKLEHL